MSDARFAPGAVRLALENGATPLSVPLTGVAGAEAFEGVVVFSVGGKVLLRETKRLELARPLETMGMATMIRQCQSTMLNSVSLASWPQ